MKLSDAELVELAMNNAYSIIMGDSSVEDILEQGDDFIIVPDPDLTDEELSEDLIEYFISTEEYEKCTQIRDMMRFREEIYELVNPKDVK